jgi:site-specific DNA-methyltransferase (adenine-specific)/site-specific DNA-methyltransferase (cytosine-N4-specific)
LYSAPRQHEKLESFLLRYKSSMHRIRSTLKHLDSIIHGDCLNTLKGFKDNSIDFIVTSPPYADRRKNTYGGIPPSKYVEWFLPISAELLRVLKPDGSFILNVKERSDDGQRLTYIIELILEMKKQNWCWIEEYIWHKRNCYPGKWPNRFRDAWERLLHFSKNTKFRMYQDAVMVPTGEWARSRLKNLSRIDMKRDESHVKSGFGKKVANWVGREMAYPTNVLHLATECGNRNHSATFPRSLPEWFIKLFTQPGDVVLDPFSGSGTTALVAAEMQRHYIGIEIQEDYVHISRNAIAQEQKERQRRLFRASGAD